jgi:hypothetical protein
MIDVHKTLNLQLNELSQNECNYVINNSISEIPITPPQLPINHHILFFLKSDTTWLWYHTY